MHLACEMRNVRLPGRKEELTMVVGRGFGQEPLMILTNLPVRRRRRSIWQVVLSYITRWRIEETIHFVKKSYQLEDARCLTYHRFQALMVTAVGYFAAVYMRHRTKLQILPGHVPRASPRRFGIPDFRLYALAEGIRQFLYSQTQGVKKFLELQNPIPVQPRLFDP